MFIFTAVSPVHPSATHALHRYFSERQETFPEGAQGYNVPAEKPTEFIPPHGIFLLSSHDHHPITCGGIRRICSSEAIRYELKHLWVHPDMRRNGIASALLAELEAHARKYGARELLLDTHDALEAANAFYASKGFHTTAAYNTNPNATLWYKKYSKNKSSICLKYIFLIFKTQILEIP